MALEIELIRDLPTTEHFTLLSDHQQETPGTFFGGKPVLHLRCPQSSIRISREDLESQPVLANLRYEDTSADGQAGEDQVVIDEIDVWVSSSYLTLVSNIKALAVEVPYQAITVHAQEGSAVLLGLNLSDANTADEDLVFVQLRIVPTNIETYDQSAEDEEPQGTNGDTSQPSNPAQALFKAIADCQELNPDPLEEGDEEYDETAPGATGWITSENLQDFVDENGELKISDATVIDGDKSEEPAWPLGPGAGRTRQADEIDAADRAEEETKWQRTG